MATRALFPTLVYTQALQSRGAGAFNAQLLRECQQLRKDDPGGRRWSKKNYPGGYTSYSSAHRLHLSSPTFATLERKLARHVRRFGVTTASALERQGENNDRCRTSGAHAALLHARSERGHSPSRKR